jgi:hypothetical protein
VSNTTTYLPTITSDACFAQGLMAWLLTTVIITLKVTVL